MLRFIFIADEYVFIDSDSYWGCPDLTQYRLQINAFDLQSGGFAISGNWIESMLPSYCPWNDISTSRGDEKLGSWDSKHTSGFCFLINSDNNLFLISFNHANRSNWIETLGGPRNFRWWKVLRNDTTRLIPFVSSIAAASVLMTEVPIFDAIWIVLLLGQSENNLAYWT